MQEIRNVYYSNAETQQQSLDIYLPDAKAFPVFIYFHGGGLKSGDKADPEFFTDLQQNGVCVISANYRMYPSAVYPDFIMDAAEAVSWAYNNIPKYGEITDFYVGGSSAGGYITQMLCFDKKYLAAHNIDADSLSGYINDAGQPTLHFNVLEERKMDSRRVIIDEGAPIYHICAERRYPPMKIIVSDHDMQNRYEQTCLLISTLKHLNEKSIVDFQIMENTTHCSYINQKDGDGRYILADIIYKFISKYGH